MRGIAGGQHYRYRYRQRKRAPVCSACNSAFRPSLALFGEVVNAAERPRARDAICDALFVLAVGTHIAVNPVAAMVHAAKDRSPIVVEINLARTAAFN
jgi:NAD-dependent SIR2 family protein deacetylase